MENKEVANVRKVLGELIGGYILYGIFWGILYKIAYNTLVSSMGEKNLILTAVIAVVLQGVAILAVWKSSVSSTFKKRVMSGNDIPAVIKGLVIFTLIISALTMTINLLNVEENIQNSLERNINYRMVQSYVERNPDSELMQQYQVELDKLIEQAEKELYVYIFILNGGGCIVSLGIVLSLRKKLAQNAI